MTVAQVLVTGADVAAFIGKAGDAETIEQANNALTVIVGMARAYTRDAGGFDGPGADVYVRPDLKAVVVAASARLMANTSQIGHSETIGPWTKTFAGGFSGWSLAEQTVLNRYRRKAQ